MSTTTEQVVIGTPPYFDPAVLRRTLTGLYNDAKAASEVRAAVIDRLKQLVAGARAAAEAQLARDGDGRRCAIGLSHFQDELVRLALDYTVTHVYRAENPSDAERMAIIATGGYGRGLLAPGSDIDLLFLLPYKQTPWGESVAEAVLYLLWDLGFKVGHATRTVDQCLRYAQSDMTIRTSLLDARLVHGDAQIFEELSQRFRAEVVAGTARAFVDAKMAEREQRHKRAGESRYLVEPNVKDGKGGLRDLHTLHWMAKYIHGEGLGEAARAAGIFTPDEIALFARCENFLWTVRCHLHFFTGRPEERLSFDVQSQMAHRLGYKDHGGLKAVERFMKHYFLVAKDVGDLTSILCSALEMQQLKSAPRINERLNPLNWRMRRQIRTTTDFRVDNDRLNIADADVFTRDPVNLIRLFAHAEKTGAFLHPAAIRRLRHSHRLIDEQVRRNPEANRIFVELLTSRTNPEIALRRMNDAGILGRFIPEFGRVVSMMQFNMYHHFTVDEHLLRTVGELHAIEDGELADTLPLSSEVVKSIQNRRALYVAAFLHDIGKGRIEDHSIVGARIADDLCPRFGLTAAETETVAWLIRQHLTMSNIAQSRDLGDLKTIRDFADIVQSPERLKLLLLLTVADIRAVGPGTWNGWKGQLLRQLYYETEPLVAGGHTQTGRKERVAQAQSALRAMLADWPAEAVDRFIERQYPDYWLKIETRKQAEHARLIRRAEAEGEKLATAFTSDGFTGITELSVIAPNHPRLLALFAGCCAAAGANIIGAQVSTTRDGIALDTFLLQREFADDADENRRMTRIGQTITRVLKGETRLAALLAKRRPSERRLQAFQVAPEVVLNNTLSDSFTVIEVSGLDRPGLLYDLTSTLSDLSLDITSAHITTYGEKAVDVFYVTDLTSKKIVLPSRQKTIRDRLAKALGAGAAVGIGAANIFAYDGRKNSRRTPGSQASMPTPCIITVAITGSLPQKSDNPAVPITVAEQIESTQAAFEAGATLAHCHVRQDDGKPTSDPERFGRLLEGLRQHCPGMIVQLSTGGRSGNGRERGGMLPLKPDMASLSTGSCNFPTRVYENSPELVDWLAAEMLKYDVKPEVEAFDLSMIFKAVEMQKGRADEGAAARAVRHGRQERDAGRSRDLRVLRQDAEAARAGRDLDRRRHRPRPADLEPLVARARRPLPHRPRGQRALGQGDARAVECRAGEARGRPVPGVRASCCDGGRGEGAAVAAGGGVRAVVRQKAGSWYCRDLCNGHRRIIAKSFGDAIDNVC